MQAIKDCANRRVVGRWPALELAAYLTERRKGRDVECHSAVSGEVLQGAAIEGNLRASRMLIELTGLDCEEVSSAIRTCTLRAVFVGSGMAAAGSPSHVIRFLSALRSMPVGVGSLMYTGPLPEASSMPQTLH